MPSPRNAQIIAIIVAFSFLIGSIKAQAPAKHPDAAKQKPDYSQEALVIEQLSTSYRFERNGTGQRELSFRAKIQSEAGVERFGQLIFGYSSANERLDMDFVRVRKADGTIVNATASDIQDLTAPVAREALNPANWNSKRLSKAFTITCNSALTANDCSLHPARKRPGYGTWKRVVDRYPATFSA